MMDQSSQLEQRNEAQKVMGEPLYGSPITFWARLCTVSVSQIENL